MNRRKQVNIQGDREFQALSEYLLTFRKGYYLSYDPSKILTEQMVRTTAVWKFDHDGNSIPFDLFFSR
jgi:hypothetical protein